MRKGKGKEGEGRDRLCVRKNFFCRSRVDSQDYELSRRRLWDIWSLGLLASWSGPQELIGWRIWGGGQLWSS